MPQQRLKRVAFDAHSLDGKPQGSATFVARILGAMAKKGTTFQPIIYCEDPDRVEKLIGRSSFEYRQIPKMSAAYRLIWAFPHLFKLDQIDLGVFQAVAPPLSSVPSFVVIHDVLPFTHPHLFPPAFRLSRQMLFHRSMKRAAGIATVSETVKSEIGRLFPKLQADCITATNGPSFDIDQYFATGTRPLPATLLGCDKYILAVGRIEKRKNVDLLVNAFLSTSASAVKLVIVGKQDLGFKWAPEPGDKIIHLQNVPNDQLLSLYRNASLFVYPSSAEGFGIPLLDALLSGIPSIASNQTAIPEVASGLAKLFDPNLPDSKETLAGLINSHFDGVQIAKPTLDQRLSLAGRFNWEKSSAKLAVSIDLILQNMKSPQHAEPTPKIR